MEKKVFKVLIMITVLVMAVTTAVQANSFTASMTPSKTTIKPGTEFQVTVKISNLDVGSNGINTLSGFLKYDAAVFEVINESNVEGVNDWKATFSSDNGKITLIKTQFVKTDEEVFQVTFKSKSAEEIKKDTVTGSITFTKIYGSNSQDDINAYDISTNIKVTKLDEELEETNNSLVLNSNAVVNNSAVKNVLVSNKTGNTLGTTKNTTNNTTNNAVNKVDNKAVNSTVNLSTGNKTTFNTVGEEDIPYTGVEDTIVYVLFAAIALALVFYVKFEKLNKDMR